MINNKALFCLVLVFAPPGPELSGAFAMGTRQRMTSNKYKCCQSKPSFHKALYEVQAASLPFVPYRVADMNDLNSKEMMVPGVIMRARVGEGVPPPLCAGRCVSPPTGPVCAFDAAGIARTFATLCELEAVSCRESTYYAITSLGEC